MISTPVHFKTISLHSTGGMVQFLAFLSLCMFLVFPLSGNQTDERQKHTLNLMPMPENVAVNDGFYPLTEDFSVSLDNRGGRSSERISKAISRFLHRLSGRTGLFFKTHEIGAGIPTGGKSNQTGLTVSFQRTGEVKLGEEESYTLTIDNTGIRLEAVTDIGAMHGIETLLQLLDADPTGYGFPFVDIKDKPRFPWRGLMIDSCRHFFPVDAIKRNLDAMAAVKLNVFHWHLSENQGFRVECKSFPKLHLMGSDGLYYTQDQIRDVIAYAADRGIRVMPEFDIPGHSTAWFVGYPQYASAPGPYSIERLYGVFDPTFNPTTKATYTFFTKFFKEMAALFPDEYMHIGGDENNGVQWDSNPGIQAFKSKHNIKDNHNLQAYFNKKILAILTKYRKKMMGWDEIFQPELPTTIVIHSWRGKESLKEAAVKDYNSVLSNGYYIDLAQPTDFHYLNDPLSDDLGLNEEQKKRILGGEATMWAELISEETIDSRIWPRTAAIAERFWSPAGVKDVRDMYRRLDGISLQLEEHGLTHIKNRDMILRRLAKNSDIEPLKVLLNVFEPLEGYNRHSQATYTFFSPLTRFVDAAWPDAPKSREFGFDVETFMTQNPSRENGDRLLTQLNTWKENHEKLKRIIDSSPVLKEIETASEDLSKIAEIGIQAVENRLSGTKRGEEWLKECKDTLEKAKQPRGHGELTIISAIGRLLQNN